MSQPICYYLPQPPRAWSRVQNACFLGDAVYDIKKIEMMNKGNVLQYKGNSSVLIFTFLPLSIFATASKSSYFAPVHDPNIKCSTSSSEVKLVMFSIIPNILFLEKMAEKILLKNLI